MPVRACLTLFLVAIASFAAEPVSFSKQIKPILEARCLKCHGSAIQLGKLDLRSRESSLAGGEHGPSLVPGKAESSAIYRRVAGLDKPAMPMDGKLTGDESAAVKLWIDQGATWETAITQAHTDPRDYWAFRRPVHRTPAAPGNPIDAFLKTTASEADRVTLLRRAYFDLTGVPPSPAEAAAFLNDARPDAWERLIDRLLDSPRYGERWGRHWLDVARYADSNGFEHDFDRPNAWRYRDYVIRAFNEDKPYDVFLREQLAGDEIPHVTNDSLIATGFLRNYAKVGYREKDNPEFRYDYLDDMIGTIGRGILGLTVQCARCHDHKFDPIPQKDYYRLQAVLWPAVEVDHPLVPANEAAAYQRKTDAVNARVAGLRKQLRSLEQPYRDLLLPPKYKTFPENVRVAIATPEEKRTPGQKLLASQVLLTVSVSSAEIDRVMKSEDLAAKKTLLAQIKTVELERPAPIPVAMGITDGDYRFTPDGPGDEPAPGKGVKKTAFEGTYTHTGPGRYEPPPSFLLIHGDVNSPGTATQPGFLTLASSSDTPVELPPANGRTSGRRLALAHWLTSAENPLTARVAVNRIWHNHFGRGLVASLDNFGKMGETPTNPELLDWLAVEFVDRGWSFKQMHRLIMTSRAYRASSSEPNGYPVHRLDAESVRDSILAVSGGLNLEMFGPPVFPELQPEILSSMSHGIWNPEKDGPKVWRRSVYVYRKRGLPFPMFDVFDLPDQNISCGARNVSTVPTQALILLNDAFVLRQARLFADRVRETGPQHPIETAYRLALSRAPTAQEKAVAETFLAEHDLVGLTHVLLNLNEFLYVL